MTLFRVVAATALLLPAAAYTHASDISPSDTIIVTATRTEIPLEQATVPVRVITRDDIELSLAVDPRLTTVRVPHRRMGRAAAEMLRSLILGLPIESREIEFHLVERESLASIR